MLEALYKKIAVLPACHIQLAFRCISERPQAGDKLKITKSAAFEKAVNFLNAVGAPSREYCENIEIHIVLCKYFSSLYYFVKNIISVFINAEGVAFEVPVKT